MRTMSPLALDEFGEQPFRFTAAAELTGTPTGVFAELGDMAPWFPLMRSCVWTADTTRGVGAEREVSVLGLGRFVERMLVWDPASRIAFTMIGTTTLLLDRMAEDWLIGRTDGRTRLTWTVAGAPTALGRAATPALRGALHLIFRGACRNLERRSTRQGPQGNGPAPQQK